MVMLMEGLLFWGCRLCGRYYVGKLFVVVLG